MLKLLQKIQQYQFFDTLKHTFNYFGAVLVIQGLSIVSLPIYTHYLDPASFAVVDAFMKVVSVLTILFTLNTHNAISRYYFEDKKDWQAFLGTSFVTAFSIFGFSSVILFFFKEQLLYYTTIPESLFVWIFPVVLANIVFAVFNQLFIARKESKKVSIGKIAFSYLRFIGAVTLLIYIGTSPSEERVVGDAIGSILIGLLMFASIFPYIKWTFVRAHLDYILRFSIPLIPYALSAFIINYFDFFMINFSEGNSDAGLYSFAYKIGLLFFGLDDALQSAAKVDFFKWMNAGQYDKIRGQVKSIFKFEMLGALFLIFFAYELGTLLSSKASFTEALHLVPILVMGYVFFALYQFYGRMIYFSKKTIYVSSVTVIAGLVNIALNAIFIPKYGFEAAAVTTVISYVLMIFLAWFVVVKILALPSTTDFWFTLKHLTGLLTFLAIGYWIMSLGLGFWWPILIKLGLFGIFSSIVFWDKIISLLSSKEA